jgi:hypothetical protein
MAVKIPSLSLIFFELLSLRVIDGKQLVDKIKKFGSENECLYHYGKEDLSVIPNDL